MTPIGGYDPPRSGTDEEEQAPRFAFYRRLVRNVISTLFRWNRASKCEKFTSVCLALAASVLLAQPVGLSVLLLSTTASIWQGAAYLLLSGFVLFGCVSGAVLARQGFDYKVGENHTHDMLVEGIKRVGDRYIVDVKNQNAFYLYDGGAKQLQSMLENEAIFFAQFKHWLFAFPLHKDGQVVNVYHHMRKSLNQDRAFLHTKSRIGYKVDSENCPKGVQSALALEQL